MIIYVLILFTILFFLSWNLFMSSRKVHIVTSIISTLLLLIAVIFAIGNFNHHYGMHLVNHTNGREIASVSKQSPMLIYEKLGSAKKHEIVIYEDRGRKQHTAPDTMVSNQIIRTNGKTPYLKTTHRNWQYRSGTARFWFGLAQKRQRHSVINRFYVPKRWNVLSVNQVKVMGKSAKEAGSQIKQAMASSQAKAMLKSKAQAYVRTQVVKAMKKNPRMTSKQKAIIIKKAEKSFQVRLKAQATTKVMPRALKAARKAPVGYAK